MMINISVNLVSSKEDRKDKILFIFWNDYFNRSGKYSNDFNYANELMHMTSMISNSMLYHNYDRIMCYDIEEALEVGKAAGFVHAFIQTPGNIIQKNILDTILNFVRDKNYFLAGHILDGKPKGKYLWMHEQCFLLNLTHLDNFNYRLNWEYNNTKVFQDYIRSNENFHDDYTPLWVKGIESTVETRVYDWSASWLDYGLKNNLLEVFDDNMRRSKYHLYPENKDHRETWLGQCIEENQLQNILKNSCKVDTQQHIFNNENFSKASARAVKDSIDCLVLPASGFYSVHAARYFNPKKIIFYDIDQKTLDFRKIINEEWHPSKSISDLTVDGLKPFEDLETVQIQLLDNEWFRQEIDVRMYWNIFKKIEKEYVCIDIINNYQEFSKLIPNNGNVYVWLNSIYTYSINIWNHKPAKIFESYFGLIYRLKEYKNKIWIDCKEPTGQYRTYEVHRYVPDATMFGNANYRKYS